LVGAVVDRALLSADAIDIDDVQKMHLRRSSIEHNSRQVHEYQHEFDQVLHHPLVIAV
jgi:hypothetical protein